MRDEKQAPLASGEQTYSLVLPVYNQAATLPAMLTRLARFIQAQTAHYEVIVVDAGSTDQTVGAIVQATDDFDHLKLVQLNQQHTADWALTIGLQHATGAAIIALTPDLMDPPSAIPAFIKAWQDGAVVVHGKRRQRHWWQRLRHHFAGPTAALTLIDHQLIKELAAMPLATILVAAAPQQTLIYDALGQATGGQTGTTLSTVTH